MNFPARKMDVVAMVSATGMACNFINDVLDRADRLRTDSARADRLAKQECKSCFYVAGKIGGAAMTNSSCGLCGKPLMFGSTCIDAICPECAKEHSLCKHCGGDLEMRIGRRKWPTSTVGDTTKGSGG